MTTLTAERPQGQPNASRNKVAKGFTLIEVMIVVAIVAILASVALPAYTAYIRRGQLQEAFTNMADQRIKLEQYYQDNRAYGQGKFCFGNTSNTVGITGSKYFSYACTTDKSVTGESADGLGYQFTATGVTGTNAAGYAYTITHSGAKATTYFAGSAVTGVSCWAAKSTSDCN